MYEKLIKENAQCDLCGRTQADVEIYQSHKFIRMCEHCITKLEALPDNMKEKIERYLIGNVI